MYFVDAVTNYQRSGSSQRYKISDCKEQDYTAILLLRFTVLWLNYRYAFGSFIDMCYSFLACISYLIHLQTNAQKDLFPWLNVSNNFIYSKLLSQKIIHINFFMQYLMFLKEIGNITKVLYKNRKTKKKICFTYVFQCLLVYTNHKQYTDNNSTISML